MATCLAAATYYLLKTPHTYEQLKAEIRGRYQSYEDINAASALQLTYLQAVINESLRIHPPGSQGFPRVSPGIDIDGYYVPKGVGASRYRPLDPRSTKLLPDRSLYQRMDSDT